ncbi:hypothetical protein J4221_04180 [Candidatus Pacearchaeota archaeon]|nr:hypothetical protein [Candidatus Pacearchaeota archaeon]
MRIKELIIKVLGIVAWGLILFAIIAFVLKLLGIISSPPITEIILGGILIELIRLESRLNKEITPIKIKQSILWSDFKKRREI